jgi:hypothetical protein
MRTTTRPAKATTDRSRAERRPTGLSSERIRNAFAAVRSTPRGFWGCTSPGAEKPIALGESGPCPGLRQRPTLPIARTSSRSRSSRRRKARVRLGRSGRLPYVVGLGCRSEEILLGKRADQVARCAKRGAPRLKFSRSQVGVEPAGALPLLLLRSLLLRKNPWVTVPLPYQFHGLQHQAAPRWLFWLFGVKAHTVLQFVESAVE